MRETLNKILLWTGGALLVVGLVLFVAPARQTTRAAENYSSTWQATQVLTIDAVVGGSTLGEAAIGVWGWRVDGNVGGTTFSETWTAPSINGVVLRPGTGGQGCGVEGVNVTLLQAGCFTHQNGIGGPDTTAYAFRIRGINDYDGKESRFNQLGGRGDQKTTTCINSPRNTDETECLIQSGSYSFQHIHEPGMPTRDRWLGGGTLLPLRWTVTGTINN